MLFEFDSLAEQKANLKMIGIGGAGGNAVNRMIQAGMSGVDFIVINTDAQDLDKSSVPNKVQLTMQQKTKSKLVKTSPKVWVPVHGLKLVKMLWKQIRKWLNLC